MATMKTGRAAGGAQRKVAEAETAPITYAAALFGINRDPETLTRWLIALLVACFDPLAVCLVAAVSGRRRATGLEKRLRSSELHPSVESHLSKYRKLVPALALISAVVDRCCYHVDATALSRALNFAAYLETHALRVYAGGREAEATSAKEILKHIRKGDLSDGFSCRDIHQRGWSHLSDNEAVQRALDLLVNNDWLAEQQIRTAGRPKITYLINPAAF